MIADKLIANAQELLGKGAALSGMADALHAPTDTRLDAALAAVEDR